MWPTPASAAKQFYESNLRSAVRLLTSIVQDRRSRGSGRPPGEPQAEWRAVLVLAVAALEAGLVDVGLAVHHHRLLNPRDPTAAPNSPDEITRARGRLMNSLPLSTPNGSKIENFMLSQFGVLPSQITVPVVAHFTTLRKPTARGGVGSGAPGQFTGNWSDLAERLDVIQYFRNAIAHADSRKLQTPPQVKSNTSNDKGTMWAKKTDSTWSLQMPHTVTAVRATVSVFNTVAFTLFSVVGLGTSSQSVLRSPDDVVPF